MLRGMYLSDELFAADAMSASRVAFEAMKVADLKEELLERGASRNGVKSTLQRRLHGLIVQAASRTRSAICALPTGSRGHIYKYLT